MDRKFFKINLDQQGAIVNSLQRQTLDSHESYFEFLTGSKKFDWYNLKIGSQELDYHHPFANATLVFSADKEEVQYDRKAYTEFDLLGDVGGFFSAFRIIGQLIIYYLGTFNYETLLISKVFKHNDVRNFSSKSSETQNQQLFQENQIQDIVKKRQSISQFYFWKCRKNRWRQYCMVRKRVLKDMDII